MHDIYDNKFFESLWKYRIDNKSLTFTVRKSYEYNNNNNNKSLYSAVSCVTQSAVTQNECNTI